MWHIAYLLISILLFGGVRCARSLPEKPPTLFNVGLSKPFVESSPGDLLWKGLTDGESASDTAPGCYATDDSPQFPKSVVIDLGGVYPVRQITIINSLNGNTKTITLYHSTSRYRWGKGWRHVFPQGMVRPFSQTIPDRPVRYVKIVFEDTYGGGFGGDNIIFLREVQVLAPTKEPVAISHAVNRSLWNRVRRDLRVARHSTLDRGVPARIVWLGDGEYDAENEKTAPHKLLEQMLHARLATKNPVRENALPSPVAVTLAGGRYRPLAETAASLNTCVELQDADIVIVCFEGPEGVKDVPAFAGRIRNIFAYLNRASDAAVIGVIPPQMTPTAKSGAGKSSMRATLDWSAVRRIYLESQASLVDLHSIARAIGEDLNLFDTRGRFTEEGRQFVAEEVFALLAGHKAL